MKNAEGRAVILHNDSIVGSRRWTSSTDLMRTHTARSGCLHPAPNFGDHVPITNDAFISCDGCDADVTATGVAMATTTRASCIFVDFFKVDHSINKSAIPSAQQYIWFTPFCWPPTRPPPPPHQPTLLSSCCCGCWSAGGGLFPLHHQPFNCSTLKYIAPFKPETGEPECGLTWINKVRALFSKKKEEKIRQKWRTFIF